MTKRKSYARGNRPNIDCAAALDNKNLVFVGDFPRNCSITSDLPDIITVQWFSPLVISSFDSYRVVTISLGQQLVSNSLPATTLLYDITGLQVSGFTLLDCSHFNLFFHRLAFCIKFK